jgi:hypothetical protein
VWKAGDKVHQVTEKLGIKECVGCKKRRQTLNAISRRGLIGGGVIAALMLKNNLLWKGWKLMGATSPDLGEHSAEGFVRTCILAQSAYHHKADSQFWDKSLPIIPEETWDAHLNDGKWQSRTDMLLSVMELVKNSGPDSSPYYWRKEIKPYAAEDEDVVPGWKLHFALAFGGFRLILVGKQITHIADEHVRIYHAATPAAIPDPAKLEHVEDFPGAVDWDEKLPASSSRFVPPTLRSVFEDS